MIGFVRKIVAGPKNSIKWNGKQLDLTYITKRLLGMAYPASGFQKTYRNSIDDVAEYFQDVHDNNFLVINVSMRKYEYQKFDNNVNDYVWQDHQAPVLTTIFEICEDIRSFLSKSEDGVVVVHCNHGKGRTGTALISFMLFARQFKDVEEALNFYNKRRFRVDSYGVDQPCQRRYLCFVDRVLRMPEIPRKLKAFKLIRIKQKGLEPSNYYLQVSVTRTGETKHTKLSLTSSLNNNALPLINDIFIELFEVGWKSLEQVGRINYNLFFLQFSQSAGAYQVEFQSQDIKVNGKHPNFKLCLQFAEFCQCHSQPWKAYCECEPDRIREQKQWQNMIAIIKYSKGLSDSEMNTMVHGPSTKEIQSEICDIELDSFPSISQKKEGLVDVESDSKTSRSS